MARITVEDCLENVENRFSLVLITAERTKQLLRGAHARVDISAHANKEVVTALREIAAGYIKYYEKDPDEVPAEVRTEEVKRAVAARQVAYEAVVRPSEPAPSADLSDEDDELDEAELDNFADEFEDDDLDDE